MTHRHALAGLLMLTQAAALPALVLGGMHHAAAQGSPAQPSTQTPPRPASPPAPPASGSATVPDSAPAMNRDPAAIRAGTYVLDPAHGRITWSVTHFGLSTYQGQFTGLSGKLAIDPADPTKSTLQVEVPVSGLRTNDADLDTHLRSADFLNLDKFPTASFTSSQVSRVGDRGARVRGNLTLHGVTRPVTLRVTFNAAGVHPVTRRYTLGFDGHVTIKRSQFGITTMIPAVSDEVKLELEGEFQLAE